MYPSARETLAKKIDIYRVCEYINVIRGENENDHTSKWRIRTASL